MSKKIFLPVGIMLVVFLLPFCLLAQKNVSGRVISGIDQAPVPGATILVKGTKTGTSTQVDGNSLNLS